ncbi:hypothetical protein [Paenibacillus sp. NRS-1780]|uniref:hypothetical protein n=1 Tax=Paenibacillus sp. NRS-1780 TaxID=3233904 RepID=UPI003D27924A
MNRSSQDKGDGYEQTWQPIHLLHDACIAKPRDAKNPSGSADGFVSGSVVYYKKTINVTKELIDKRILLEFEGVCGTTRAEGEHQEVSVNENNLSCRRGY